jgi:hypothetical protein
VDDMRQNIWTLNFDSVFLEVTGICSYSNPSSIVGDKFIESGAFSESALDELNIVWD